MAYRGTYDLLELLDDFVGIKSVRDHFNRIVGFAQATNDSLRIVLVTLAILTENFIGGDFDATLSQFFMPSTSPFFFRCCQIDLALSVRKNNRPLISSLQ